MVLGVYTSRACFYNLQAHLYNRLAMTWKAPSASAPTLYLPDPTAVFSADVSTWMTHEAGVYCNVDSRFVTVWEQGPVDPTYAALADALTVLSIGFCRLIVAGQGQTSVEAKDSEIDLVTDVDKGIESLFRAWVDRFCPSHKFIGEEGRKDPFAPDEKRWFVDPVDGTHNFVHGRKEVSLHIALLGHGKPLVAVVGKPFFDCLYVGHCEEPGVRCVSYGRSPEIVSLTPRYASEMVIGTEYLDHRETDAQTYKAILEQVGGRLYRVKSIGINLLAFLEGDLVAFYKTAVKFWDVAAPMALLRFLYGTSLQMELMVPFFDEDRSETFDPFSDDPVLVDRFNDKHRGNCRIGFIVITSNRHPALRDIILASHRDLRRLDHV